MMSHSCKLTLHRRPTSLIIETYTLGLITKKLQPGGHDLLIVYFHVFAVFSIAVCLQVHLSSCHLLPQSQFLQDWRRLLKTLLENK